MRLEIDVEGHYLLQVDVRASKRIDFVDYFDITLTFEEHSGAVGDIVVIRGVPKDSLAKIFHE